MTEQATDLSIIEEGTPMPVRIQGARETSLSALAPKSFQDICELAKIMASADVMVGKVCRGNIGNSAAIVMQAVRWGMDPFAISHEAFIVQGNMGYGAKLINAVIQANAPIKTRLSYEFSGEGPTRRVRVFATFKGETEPKDIITPMYKDIGVKNSPLWKNDPDQQFRYYGSRTWARAHAPDVLMGVITQDEIADNPEMRDVTPASSPESAELEELFLARIEKAETGDDLREIQNDLKASDIDGFNRLTVKAAFSDRIKAVQSSLPPKGDESE